MKTNHKLLIAKTLFRILHHSRALVGLGDHLIARRRNINWSLDLSQGIDLYIYLFGEFEIQTSVALRRIVQPGNRVVDIGANIGAHTLTLANLVGPAGKVFAFEPTDFAFGKLRTNLSLNPELAGRVTPVQNFVGRANASDAPSSIYSSWPLVRQEHLSPSHGGEAKTTTGASTIALDRFREIEGIDRVDVIKLDVDGYECEVLAGSSETIRRCKPVFVMEIAPSALDERGASLDALAGSLASFGYSLTALDGKPLPIEADGLRALIREGESINVIARVTK